MSHPNLFVMSARANFDLSHAKGKQVRLLSHDEPETNINTYRTEYNAENHIVCSSPLSMSNIAFSNIPFNEPNGQFCHLTAKIMVLEIGVEFSKLK